MPLGQSWVWWPSGDEEIVTIEPPPLNITVLHGEEAGEEWMDGTLWLGEGAHMKDQLRSPSTPPRWDSNGCMRSWGMPELQSHADQNGYVVFIEGREQLGNNRFLISDGLVIARALNRTLVEFPMEDSRIAKADAELGLCDYWDCNNLCKYHRLLDLWTFRSMLRDRLINVDDFVTVESANQEKRVMENLETAANMTDFFVEFEAWQVIVMKSTWKSGLRREPVEFLRPNLFYQGRVQGLLDAQNRWQDGRYLAVQWRTETSRGNLSKCYERYVRSAVEDGRRYLGLDRDQVYFNTDLVGQASTTYNTSVVLANQGVVDRIRAEYPAAMDNTVYNALREEQDAGVKAMLSGLVSASAPFLLSSSYNGSGDDHCQKPHSKYIDLIAEWRMDVLGKSPDSMVEIFPVLEERRDGIASLYLLFLLLVVMLAMGVVARRTDVVARAKSIKST